MRERLPIVGVMGSGTERHTELAVGLGAWLATQNVHLLTGGGGGVMEEVCRGFFEVGNRTGRIIGIIPGDERGRRDPASGYPNPWVEIPIYTHLPLTGRRGAESLSRNHINVLSADVVVALPGSVGTASEVSLALRYGRPLIACLDDRSQIPRLPSEVRVEPDLERVKAFVLSVLSRVRAKQQPPRITGRP
jgi:uncharacterized protein (TIGR00725 family)